MTITEALCLFAAGAANILGALAVVSHKHWSKSAIEMLIALAAGFMLAVSLLDIIPESMSVHGETALLVVLAGYFLVHLTQHTLTEHFHFGEETHAVSRLVGQTALVGLLLHTFVDGVAIVSAFESDEQLGLLVFMAITLHKFPEGLAVASICIAAGMGRKLALMAAMILGLATLLGGILTGPIAVLRDFGLPLSGGVTLYVAASNLVPEFQAKRGWRLPLFFLLGCVLYFVSRSLLLR
ncbi:MAG TPA: ZIP family metal transporter [Woeseiaceae bacterium]|nr:ZIP family metal transporter [Woeseiaceae bacterium]